MTGDMNAGPVDSLVEALFFPAPPSNLKSPHQHITDSMRMLALNKKERSQATTRSRERPLPLEGCLVCRSLTGGQTLQIVSIRSSCFSGVT